jgi:hypothetical protein
MLIDISVALIKEIMGYGDLDVSFSDVSGVDRKTELAMTRKRLECT